MSIQFGTVFSFDDLTTGVDASVGGRAFDLGDGRVVYTWVDPDSDLARFSVVHVDGTLLVAPTDVDASTFPEVPPAFGSSDQGVFAATPTSGGGFSLMYTVDADKLFPLNGDRYIRNFDADGTPDGGSTLLLADAPFFLAGNTVSTVLADGSIAIAHDSGLSVLDADGSVIGGSAAGPGFATSDNGFQVIETDGGGILVIKATGSLNFSTFTFDLDITGQYYTSTGALDGAEFTIKEDISTPSAAQAIDWRVDADILTDGRIAVAWIDNAADPDSGGIMATILNADGSVDVPEFRANTVVSAGRQLSPQLYALDTGGFVVSYRTDDVISATNISPLWRLEVFDGNGNPLGINTAGGADVAPSLFGQRNTIIQPDGSGLIIDETGFAMPITIDASSVPILGDEFANNLIGTAQDDVINGLAGDDTLSGFEGDDTLDGGEGNDTVDYGAAFGGVSVYLQYTGRNVGGGEGRDTLIDIENLAGSNFDDRLIGDSNANILSGADGDDIIKGKGGTDTLFGNAGDDRIRAGDDVDTMFGGIGSDILIGLSGNDILEGGDGRDFLYGGRDADVLRGGFGNDELRGNRGDDLLEGGEGSDDLRGGGNNDILNGEDDNDFLFGEGSNDTLHGGSGNDSMTGGTGRDTFVFEASDGFDRIKDWEDGLDQIDLTSFGFVDFDTDVASKASDSSGNLRLNFGNGDVLFIETFALADFDASDVILS